MSSIVSCTDGSDSISAFKFKGTRSLGPYILLTNATCFHSFRNLQKSQMLHVVNPKVSVRLLPITSANCIEV